MNYANFPPYIPNAAAMPVDVVQVQSFALAGEINFAYLNRSLGFTLDIPQFRKLQHHFYHDEQRNPNLGELRLLGHLMSRTPLSRRIAPGELFTDSDVIMETWADVMAGYAAVHGDATQPCSLSEVLSLPEAYLIRQGIRSPLSDDQRVVSESGIGDALSQGFKPLATLQAHGGAPRQVWTKAKPPKEQESDLSPEIGDVLLVLPPAKLEAVCAFLYDHPAAEWIKAVSAVSNTSLTQAAVAMCAGYGLSVELDTLVPPTALKESRIKAYLDAWETDAPRGSVYTLLRIAPTAQVSVFTALSDHGLAPRLLGTVTKQPVVSFQSHGMVSVYLKEHILRDVSAAKPCRYLLPVPSPINGRRSWTAARTPVHDQTEIGRTVADLTACVKGAHNDGFTPAVQSVLSLCFEFAARGIGYHQISLSPTLFFDGAADAPLLLSAVCGLYRAAAELGLPLTTPEILFKSSDASPENASLILSLVASTAEMPVPAVHTLQSPDTPLGYLPLDEAPRWEDVRGLLYLVASEVKAGRLSAHPLDGDSVLEVLTRLASPEVALTAELFDEHEALLSAPRALGFMVEGSIPRGGLHVGTTRVRPEGTPLPPQSPSTPHVTVTPYPTVTLQELKDKETQRRKEFAAMEKIKAFEPLCKTPRTVLLDTDIGPDCDDVGALAVLIYYAKQYGFPIGGICNCTSNQAGNGVIDAVCRRCGMETPPLGQWHGEGFMNDAEHRKYNVAVAEAHSEAYRNGTLPVEDEVTFYRKRLAAARDGEVMVISIGMFNNLAALLDSPADDISPLNGMELVKAKVYALVSMAATLPQGRECNVVSDYKSAERVFASWPTPIYLSDFHIGVNVKTGYGHITDPEAIMADPLPMSYHLYTKDWNWEGAVKGQNASYDLTAVQFAALGICDLYGLGTPGDLEFYAEVPDLPDATRFIENPMGNKIFMTKKVSDEAIAESLQKILNSF